VELTGPKTPTFQYISGEAVYPIWVDVRDLLEWAAVHSHDEWEVEDVLVKVSLGKQQLWVFSEGDEVQLVVVTEIVEYPRKSICNIFAMAGAGMVKHWPLFSQKVFPWLEALGVAGLEATCRDVMMRKARALGFVKKANVVHFPWKEQS
jgi:hypothetical protein